MDGCEGRGSASQAHTLSPSRPRWPLGLGTGATDCRSPVARGSPAADAGLRRGDIVVSVDGHNIVTATAIQKLMVEDAIARQIEMTVLAQRRAWSTCSWSRANSPIADAHAAGSSRTRRVRAADRVNASVVGLSTTCVLNGGRRRLWRVFAELDSECSSKIPGSGRYP